MLKKILNQSETVKDSSILIGATLVSQLIPIALQPFLRRIFSPEEFGLLAIYFSIVSILCLSASLNYQSTITLPKSEERANNLVLGAIRISFIFSLIIFILLFFTDNFIIQLFHFPIELKRWILFIPLCVFLNSCHLIFTNWLIRKKSYKALAINKISRRAFEGAGQITAPLYFKGNGLLLGNIIGDIFNFLTYLLQFKKSGGKFSASGTTKISEDLKSYIHFPKYSLLPNLLITIAGFLPIFIVNANYSKHITGQYDLSTQMLGLPVALISMSISQILLQKVSYAKNHGLSIAKELLHILRLLVLLACIFVPPLFFFGQEIFSFVFGQEWQLSGAITEKLCISYALMIIVTPLATTFISLEKLKLNAIWQISHFLVLFSLVFIKDIPFHDFILLIMIIELAFYTCYGILTYKIVKEYEEGLKHTENAKID